MSGPLVLFHATFKVLKLPVWKLTVSLHKTSKIDRISYTDGLLKAIMFINKDCIMKVKLVELWDLIKVGYCIFINPKMQSRQL